MNVAGPGGRNTSETDRGSARLQIACGNWTR